MAALNRIFYSLGRPAIRWLLCVSLHIPIPCDVWSCLTARFAADASEEGRCCFAQRAVREGGVSYGSVSYGRWQYLEAAGIHARYPWHRLRPALSPRRPKAHAHHHTWLASVPPPRHTSISNQYSSLNRQVVMLACTVSSAVLIYLSLPFFVAIIGSTATAVTSWMAFEQLAIQTERYTSTVQAVDNLLSWWYSLGDVEQVRKWAASSECAFEYVRMCVHAWARVGMCMCMCGHVCVHVRGTACTRAKGVCLGMHMQGAGHAIRTHCTEDLHTELHSGAALSAPYLPPADESPVGCRAGFDGAHRSLGRARRNHPHTGESHAAKFRPAKPGWLGGRQGRHRWRQ